MGNGERRRTVDEQRMRFVVLASRREKTMRELCEEFEISRPTGYEWLRRYERGGIAGVVEKSRRPEHSPQRTAAGIEQRVVELRQQRPDWGAKKLRVLLQREGIEVPRITIHRILLRHEFGATAGPASGGGATIPARSAERAMADGFQRVGGMERGDGATVGAGRS